MINNCKKAFTLAEILIVIGVIGIIADLTIPTLIADTTQKINIVKWRKTYAEISNAFQLMQLDMDSFYDDYSLVSQHDMMVETILPYFKVIKTCNTGDDSCWHKGFTKPQAIYQGWDLSSACPSFQLANGINVIVNNDNYKTGWVMVDINGSKKPNTFGKDVFAIRLDFINNQSLPFFEKLYGTCIPPTLGDYAQLYNLIGIGCSEYYLFNDN